jgi:hypothetical protein
VLGRRGGKDVPITVRGALWLADLKFQAWVPVEDADGNLNQMTASPPTLQGLLNPSWLEHNDAAIALLSGCFDFDELELRLLSLEPDKDRRVTLRNGLAKLVETAGADPNIYEGFAHELEARRRRERDIARCRKLGLAIQDAIKRALEGKNCTLTLIDRGYDFEVVAQSDDILTEATSRIELGPYLLEVKATTTGKARMTPTQAGTAQVEPDRFILCVVDLRGIAPDRLDGDWSAADVMPLALIVKDIGNEISKTCEHVDRARESDVAIVNAEALRYEVPVHVWSRGVSITEWIDQLSTPRGPDKE